MQAGDDTLFGQDATDALHGGAGDDLLFGERRQGGKVRARAFDALIASIALSRDLPLYTCDADDFQGIKGLVVVAVPHPDRAT